MLIAVLQALESDGEEEDVNVHDEPFKRRGGGGGRKRATGPNPDGWVDPATLGM